MEEGNLRLLAYFLHRQLYLAERDLDRTHLVSTRPALAGLVKIER
jgi:hypothetical protein